MIDQVLLYRCDYCPREFQVGTRVAVLNELARPSPPDGWTLVLGGPEGGRLACPDHAVTVHPAPVPAGTAS